jgi:apolipoprotein N-acyltransferase
LAVLQVATITGEYGVTFLVVMANAAIAGVVIERAWRGAIVAGLLLALVHVSGAVALFADPAGPVVRLAAAQPSILVGEQSTATGRAKTLNRLDRLTRDAAASRPALIAWPESAVVGNFRSNPFLTADVKELAREASVALVMGVTEVEKFASVDAWGRRDRHVYNAAYVVTAEGVLEAPYMKRVLLPFAEYVPLRSVIGWPAWLVPHMIDMFPGDKAHLFKLQDGTLFSVLICWESLFAGLARESVGMGARVLVQLNNNTWFGRTAAAPQQNISSVLRAVENRVPVVLSSNTGPSQIIDPYGRVVAHTAEIFTADFAVGDVKLGSGETLYTQVGDLFVFITIGLLAIGVFWRLLTFP